MVLLVATAAILAGCLNGASRPGSSNSVARASPGGPDGVLRGLVLDEEARPVPNATVRVLGTTQVTQSSRAGAFEFEALPAGLHTLEAAAPGYFSVQGRVAIGPGQTADVTLVLARAPDAAYHRTTILRGFLDCSYTAAGASGTCALNTTTSFKLEFARNWSQLLVEMEWEPQGFNTNPELRVSLVHQERIVPGVSRLHFYGRVEGASALRAVLEPGRPHPELGGNYSTPPQGEPHPVDLRVSKAPATVQGVNTLAGLSYQQGFTVYFTTFFREPNPNVSEFSAIPPR